MAATAPRIAASPAVEAPAVAAGAEPALITAPDVMGKHKPEAEALLRAAGVRDVRTDNDPGTVNFAVATVCSQTPGGHELRANLPVVLRYCDKSRIAEPPGTQLVGLGTSEAQQRARAAGFSGRIEIIEIIADGGCKPSTVCRVEPARWELDQDHRMTLFVAKKLAITTPD